MLPSPRHIWNEIKTGKGGGTLCRLFRKAALCLFQVDAFRPSWKRGRGSNWKCIKCGESHQRKSRTFYSSDTFIFFFFSLLFERYFLIQLLVLRWSQKEHFSSDFILVTAFSRLPFMWIQINYISKKKNCQSPTLMNVVWKANHMAERCCLLTFHFQPLQVRRRLKNEITSPSSVHLAASPASLVKKGVGLETGVGGTVEGERKVKRWREDSERAWERDHRRQKRRERLREGGSCATGHHCSPSPLTSMCHLTVLQIRLHMLPGDVTTYILTVGLNLHRCTLCFFFYYKISPHHGLESMHLKKQIQNNIFYVRLSTGNLYWEVAALNVATAQWRSCSTDILKNHASFEIFLTWKWAHATIRCITDSTYKHKTRLHNKNVW